MDTYFKKITLCFFIVFSAYGAVFAQSKPMTGLNTTLRVTGTVVAYNLFPCNALKHSLYALRQEGYYVVVKVRDEDPYVLVNFENKVSSDELPKILFDGQSTWNFKLRRYAKGDRVLPISMPLNNRFWRTVIETHA